MAVSFWVDGVDGGPDKVPNEVRMLVWKALRTHGVQLPSGW